MRFLYAFLLFLFPLFIHAQGDHRMLPGEQSLMPAYLNSRTLNTPSAASVTPPVSPVRTIGEWEELQALLIAWKSYPTMLREIVRAAKTETRVLLAYEAPDTEVSITNYLAATGVDTVNVSFLNIPLNSVWCRDYGPWSAYTNDVDSLITIDWIYNRPRPDDDQVPVSIATYLNTPLYQTSTAPWNIVHTGGNFMTDGFGTGFSSNLTVDENPSLSNADIDTIMQRFMGINRYIKMTTLPYDGIHHIDMHMKLLDEETILMGEYPTGVSDGPQIEANLLYVLNNYPSVYGTPYKVIRIPQPADNGLYPSNGGDYLTYTNSSFINKTVIVPTYGIPSDTTALRMYQEALPGYTITGINSLSSIPASGALHCITKELGTNDPLLIKHQALTNTTDTLNSYTVNAKIQHRSGIQGANLYYRTDTLLPWQSVAMIPFGGPPDMWNGQIPPQPAGTRVYYYIEGIALSGKTQVRPIVAPAGYWAFDVTGLTALNDQEPDFEVNRIFPNPSKGITAVRLNLKQAIQLEAGIYDAKGRFIMSVVAGNIGAGERHLFFDSSDLSAGMYLLKIQGNGPAQTLRFAVR